MAVRRIEFAAAIAAFATATTAGLILASEALSLRAVQLALGAGLVVAAWTFDDDAVRIPRILRPAPLILLAAVVGSISLSLVTKEEFEQAYFWMWLCQITGFLLAIAWRPKLGEPLRAAGTQIDPSAIQRYAVWLWWAGLGCAAIFFGAKGIPLLSSSVEQGRVDAATSGTGYLRLIAFMTVPAAILLVAAEHRRRGTYVTATAMLVILFGNRIPLVYLGMPIVVMAAVAGTKLRTRHLVAAAALALVVIAALGTYRVTTEPEFRSYDEYRVDLVQDDKLGIAVTSVTHYASVVPANATLVKQLVDEGKLQLQWGSTYFTLFLSALPGQQLSPDLLIKQLSGREFVGGGTPPTLMGEGYMNWGYPGIVIGAFIVMLLARYWASRTIQSSDPAQLRLNAGMYGYVATWCVVAQVAGLAGAATVALAGFLSLVGIRWLARVR